MLLLLLVMRMMTWRSLQQPLLLPNAMLLVMPQRCCCNLP
jgi:hypothetical protein